VITSSLAAIVGIPHEERPDVFNETHFSDVNWPGLKSAYEKSKAIAEQKSWAFVKENAQAPELVTICPGFICGPFLSQGSSATTSISAITQVMNNSLPGIPHISFPSVDVRDVALAHLRALEKPEAAN
jgi:dihydroflavonol-4-reductase